MKLILQELKYEEAHKTLEMLSSNIHRYSWLQVHCVEVQENTEFPVDIVSSTGNLLLCHIWGDFPWTQIIKETNPPPDKKSKEMYNLQPILQKMLFAIIN